MGTYLSKNVLGGVNPVILNCLHNTPPFFGMATVPGMLDTENGGNMLLCNIGNYLSTDKVKYPKRPEPQILQLRHVVN
jgi:hypothetical protein